LEYKSRSERAKKCHFGGFFWGQFWEPKRRKSARPGGVRGGVWGVRGASPSYLDIIFEIFGKWFNTPLAQLFEKSLGRRIEERLRRTPPPQLLVSDGCLMKDLWFPLFLLCKALDSNLGPYL